MVVDGFPTKLEKIPPNTLHWLCSGCGKGFGLKPGGSYNFGYLAGCDDERCHWCYKKGKAKRYDTKVLTGELPF